MQIRAALSTMAIFTVLTGALYPLALTGLAAVVAPQQAHGSLVRDERGRAVGSALIGQPFTSPRYFWGRPSATSAAPYDAAASSGSNLGPTNPALVEAVEKRIAALKASDPGNTAPIPIDLVTTSGSGLDPHVSAAAASWQIGRVARARGLDEARVRTLVDAHVEAPLIGILGEPSVNVLLLNLALDALASGTPR